MATLHSFFYLLLVNLYKVIKLIVFIQSLKSIKLAKFCILKLFFYHIPHPINYLASFILFYMVKLNFLGDNRDRFNNFMSFIEQE
jgi:hypothetical protein